MKLFFALLLLNWTYGYKKTSPDHIFYTDKQEYIVSQNIIPGSRLLNKDGKPIEVCGVTKKDTITEVYDLPTQDGGYSAGESSLIVESCAVRILKGDPVIGPLYDALPKSERARLVQDVYELRKIGKDVEFVEFIKKSGNFDVWKNVSYLKSKAKDIDFLTWNKVFQDWAQGNGKFLHDHIFVGKVSGNNIQGVHHSNALTSNTSNFQINDIRITPGTKVQKGGGFYEAEIEYWSGTQWVQKTENNVVVKNGFFPDNWTQTQLMEEISYARGKVTETDFITGTNNNYNGTLKDGQNVLLYIGSSPPPPMPNFTISIFPIY